MDNRAPTTRANSASSFSRFGELAAVFFKTKFSDGLLAPGDLQGTIQPNFENDAFLQLQPVVAEYGAHYARRSSGLRTYSLGIRVVMPAAALPCPFDCAFVAYRQAVLSRNGGDSRHQRRPSSWSFDFVKAEQQAGMKPVAHGAYMPPDPAAVENHGFIGSHHIFFQFGLEALPWLDSADIEVVLQADEKRSSVGDGVARNRRLLVVISIVVLGVQLHCC
jgi:hypothetical protein